MLAEQNIWHSDPEILGGEPVFAGTRVPVRSLFDYLEGGESLDEFLRQFPSVERAQAIAALDLPPARKSRPGSGRIND
jgi:uncharacterized protein (DUF433 family)